MPTEFRLFEDIDGLYHQIAPELADAAQIGRRVGAINGTILVLWTPEEQAVADAEDAAAAAAQAAAAALAETIRLANEAATAARQALVDSATAKLLAFGLTPAELEVMFRL